MLAGCEERDLYTNADELPYGDLKMSQVLKASFGGLSDYPLRYLVRNRSTDQIPSDPETVPASTAMPMQQTSITTDFLVVGGGVIGINIARGLKKRHPTSKVTLIEKEASCGMHASGRNSGVLHAGFYYSPDSLKAKFTREGNAQLTAYCEEKRISLNRCGKLVVAKDSTDLPALDELLKRGKANGIKLEELSEQDAKKIEPRAKTYQRALFSPTTSTVNPNAVLQAMVADAVADGVQINSGVAFVRKTDRTVQTTEGQYEAGYVVNAAGLYADQIARQFGFSERYRILPFKGLYLYSDEPPGALRTNIYPVPDLRNPFLGVHFTVTNEGKAKNMKVLVVREMRADVGQVLTKHLHLSASIFLHQILRRGISPLIEYSETLCPRVPET